MKQFSVSVSPKPFDKKVALVTGAGRGIGAATARALARQGARVLLVSRTQSELTAVEKEIEKESGVDSVLSHCGDISREDEVIAAFNWIVRRWEKIDILINNAGAYLDAPVHEMTLEQWNKIFSTNLTGTFLCCREAFRVMTTGGVIVNVSSLAGIQGATKFAGRSAYSAAKAGVVALSETLAVEGEQKGIRVNCVAPGAVETQMLKEAAPGLITNGRPEDMAAIILSLCQESSVNGALISAPTRILSS